MVKIYKYIFISLRTKLTCKCSISSKFFSLYINKCHLYNMANNKNYSLTVKMYLDCENNIFLGICFTEDNYTYKNKYLPKPHNIFLNIISYISLHCNYESSKLRLLSCFCCLLRSCKKKNL